MNFTVYPGSRISRLPRFLQIPAILLRNVLSGNRVREQPSTTQSTFSYAADGMATNHFCPFLKDERFSELYRYLAPRWYDLRLDARWRMWIATRCAQQCRMLPGAFVEFGVYRAGVAFMILSTAGLEPDRQFYLFDTFSGMPRAQFTSYEVKAGMAASDYTATSVPYVSDFLKEWSSNIVICEGDVFDTLPKTETGNIAFCHLDLNASTPTKIALQYAFPRLVPGAMLVSDDYGWTGYEDQRRVIDEFLADKPERMIALPTGQGLVVKL